MLIATFPLVTACPSGIAVFSNGTPHSDTTLPSPSLKHNGGDLAKLSKQSEQHMLERSVNLRSTGFSSDGDASGRWPVAPTCK